ncbi:MAG: DUF5615 family PIN-like protein [Chloroflexi bacterium]|nr:DUF5615 family PIN-like protein [Chloroflexota bacterium]
MRILADENLWPVAVAALRELGHDVAWIKEDSPGIPDEAVLERASSESRVLVTADKGFGDLVFVGGLPAPSGVILLRARSSRRTRTESLVAAVQGRSDWSGLFAVVDEGHVRLTSLPND